MCRTRASDLWHWQVNALPADAEAAAGAIRAGHHRLVSPGVVDLLPDDGLGFGRGVMARDPDGHALLFRQR